MDKNPLLQRLMKDKTEDVIHSSAYAEAQNAGKIGVDSAESFAVRQKNDKNRNNIQRYQDSEVVNDAYKNSGMKAQTYEESLKMATETAKKVAKEGERERLIAMRKKNEYKSDSENKIGKAQSNSMNVKEINDERRQILAERFKASSNQTKQPPTRRNPGVFR